jgi:uncharacterized protein YkwD
MIERLEVFGVYTVLFSCLLASFLLWGLYFQFNHQSSPSTKVSAQSTVRETAGLPSPNTILELVNAERTARGLGPLQANSELEEVAQQRANDMSVNVYYAHQNSTGGFYDDIMRARGMKTDYSCENLELSFDSRPEIYINDWLASNRGHRLCLLNQRATQAGYAVAVVDLPNGEAKQSIVVVAIHSTDVE